MSIPQINGNFCMISSAYNSKVFDLCQQGQNQQKIIVWTAWKPDHQLFLLTFDGTDCYIKSKHNGKYLTVQSSQKGSTIITAPLIRSASQKFFLEQTKPNSSSYFIITYTGNVLDIEGCSLFNGSKIIQWPKHGKNNQIWRFIPNEDNTKILLIIFIQEDISQFIIIFMLNQQFTPSNNLMSGRDNIALHTKKIFQTDIQLSQMSIQLHSSAKYLKNNLIDIMDSMSIHEIQKNLQRKQNKMNRYRNHKLKQTMNNLYVLSKQKKMIKFMTEDQFEEDQIEQSLFIDYKTTTGFNETHNDKNKYLKKMVNKDQSQRVYNEKERQIKVYRQSPLNLNGLTEFEHDKIRKKLKKQAFGSINI